jgi:micrococcal nuclease
MFQYKLSSCKTVDGDTVRATVDLGFGVQLTETFRLLGINTPEKRPLSTREAALKSQQRLQQLVDEALEKDSLRVKTHKNHQKGKYGRYLCELFGEQDKSFNQILLEEKLAVSFMA